MLAVVMRYVKHNAMPKRPTNEKCVVVATVWDYGWIWTRPGSGFGVGVPGRQRDGRIDLARSLLTKRPVLIEPETKWPTLSGPTTFSVLIQCRALLMVQPHWEQSGVPPKTQGSTRLLRSAE